MVTVMLNRKALYFALTQACTNALILKQDCIEKQKKIETQKYKGDRKLIVYFYVCLCQLAQ